MKSLQRRTLPPLPRTILRQLEDKWNIAVTAFLAESDWPGGKQNERTIKIKLRLLTDACGLPLAYTPCKENLQRAYQAMKDEGLVVGT